MAGQPIQAFGCFTGDDLIEIESGETVSFQDLEVGDSIAVYFPDNDTFGYSEIGFMAVYNQINDAQFMDFVEICFGPETNSSDDETSTEKKKETGDHIHTNQHIHRNQLHKWQFYRG